VDCGVFVWPSNLLSLLKPSLLVCGMRLMHTMLASFGGWSVPELSGGIVPTNGAVLEGGKDRSKGLAQQILSVQRASI